MPNFCARAPGISAGGSRVDSSDAQQSEAPRRLDGLTNGAERREGEQRLSGRPVDRVALQQVGTLLAQAVAAAPAVVVTERATTEASSSARGAPASPEARSFEQTYAFPFDGFQRRACDALATGSSVLVAAPTGAGKTVVGEFAAWLALQRAKKTFYTTPIKALSNQKYADFAALHGASNVGLLTGDNSLNGDAPVVVMTTEVLRNMIYEDSPALHGLQYVVLDEVHYLQDRYRGGVWEEILIHLPVDVLIVSLSATVSNAEEFAEWLQTLRGRTEVIIEEQRPVEIRHWYFAADELLPMFVQGDGAVIPNPRAREFERRRHRGAERPGRGGRREREKRVRVPFRTDVVERLRKEDMLPAIYFIFSRRGCGEAVKQCVRDHVRLNTHEEGREVRRYAEARVAELSPAELEVLGYEEWLTGLTRGVAAHHAGMIPPFKEAVEELFLQGLIKVVFATETLALGINMPARTVIIESLMKYTGEGHELITPGQYTQLSGRAGRRGIDDVGNSVVLYQRFTRFDTITRLASTRTYPLQSSFQPSYNMTVNLVRNYDHDEARHLVNSSFAQFQADRVVVEQERTRERLDAYLASYKQRMECELGDFDEYRRIWERLRRSERRGERADGTRSARVMEAIARLKAGDVIQIQGGKRAGKYAVVEVSQRPSERRPRVLALSESRSMIRLSAPDFRRPPTPITRLDVPKSFDVRDARDRRMLARKLSEVTAVETPGAFREKAPEDDKLRARLESHPCHTCPEIGRHLHFAERATRLERQIAAIDKGVRRRTGTLARRFDRVLEVLETLGYVKGWALTAKGETLTQIYNESDLLVVEALQRHLLDDLGPAELAALCSTLVYETRGPESDRPVALPPGRVSAAWVRLMRLWGDIRREEEDRGLDLTREPDPGFAVKVHEWASGTPLEDVLEEDDAPGDFVRAMKQLTDLLRQVGEATEQEALATTVDAAIESIQRGVVAYSALDA